MPGVCVCLYDFSINNNTVTVKGLNAVIYWTTAENVFANVYGSDTESENHNSLISYVEFF